MNYEKFLGQHRHLRLLKASPFESPRGYIVQTSKEGMPEIAGVFGTGERGGGARLKGTPTLCTRRGT